MAWESPNHTSGDAISNDSSIGLYFIRGPDIVFIGLNVEPIIEYMCKQLQFKRFVCFYRILSLVT